MEDNVMPSFDARRSTTNDVVRQAIIPLSRDSAPGVGGKALASVWSHDIHLRAHCMVTHNWSNTFLHLVAGVLADAVGEDCYHDVAEELLSGADGRANLAAALEQAGTMDRVVWICAFSINQHAGICGGFGPPPDQESTSYLEWDAKRRDSVSGEKFAVCSCRQPKAFNDTPSTCEMNKFDDMMRFLYESVE